MSEDASTSPASTPSNQILARLLERLYNALVGGPSLNCRPHTSRQRVELAAFERFSHFAPGAILPTLLAAQPVEIEARTPFYPGPTGEDATLTDADRAAKRAVDDQNRLLTKLRDIADDARDYEQDHGESALYIGYPLLHLPPGPEGGGGSRRGGGPGSPRVLAPVALVPVEIAVRRGPGTPSVTLRPRGSGADLLMPNLALLSWIEQQTGKDTGDLFTDETGEEPWREIDALARYVADALRLPTPEPFTADTPLAPAPRLRADQFAAEAGEAAAFIPAAVLGLFPVSNQGLLRDMKAMAAGQVSLKGPVASFLTVDLSPGAPVLGPEEASADKNPPPRAVIDPRQQRLVSAADPCQERAVRLARESSTLVVHGPPGTGKSQTITNMVGDHIARGERVLLVCDKRTALDVVRYRLDALGLGSLCAVVHDPQRDQRTLYKTLRERLDALADSRPPTSAVDADLDALDADLVRIHTELSGYHRVLHEAPAPGRPSFHEMVGQWLTLPDAAPELGVDAATVGALTLEELQRGHADVSELLERARNIRYAENLWVEAVGVGLSTYLTHPVAFWRGRIGALTRAAETLDADSPSGGLPALETDAVTSLSAQAEVREALAEKMDRLGAVPGVPAVAAYWVGQPPEAAQRALTGFGGMAESMKQLGAAPVDPGLTEAHAARPPEGSARAAINRSLGILRDYEAATARWYGFFYNPHKKAAQTLLSVYGLGLDTEGTRRLRGFLKGVSTRLVAQDFLTRTVGQDAVGVRAGDDDAVLSQALSAHQATLEFLTGLHDDARASSLRANILAALPEPARLAPLAESLRRSARRARLLAAFLAQARDTGLFSGDWLASQDAAWREGEALTATFASLEELLPTLESLLRINQTTAQLPASLQGPTVSLIRRHADPAEALVALRRSVLAREIGRRLATDPVLQGVDGERINALFTRFAQLSQHKRELVRDLTLARWHKRQRERLLSSTRTQLNSLGAALKRRLVTRGERAVKLRQVIAQGALTAGGDPLFDLCPVWMASPGTVAQIFPREELFDCVIFDEASQCRLEDALPVLLRARRVVVAGDPKQLPPTRFFESAMAESQNADAENDQELFEQQQGETEDLLSAALNIQAQQCYLDVHYRSRSEALIGFSNENFYDHRLQAIPGHPKNRTKTCPVRLVRVDGVYEKRVNRKEGEAVVALVKELLARPEPPSVGVACFNLTQRELINDLLEEASLGDKEFAARLSAARVRQGSGSFEGLFVKNLENVQGDERDHIIISTTFGPDAAGKFRRSFGPVGSAGGGRRLNVLVTRARDMVHVFTSIPRGEYVALAAVPSGEQPGGRWLLYAYLRYAEELAESFERSHARAAELAAVHKDGEVRIRPSETGSLLAQALAKRLAREGLTSDVHWGNEGFGIDVALHHPIEAEMVTAGVLCDMTRFAQVEDPVEWELFRLAVHLSQGWRLHRVWSPMVFRDLERVQQDIAAAATAAQAADDRTQPPMPAVERPHS